MRLSSELLWGSVGPIALVGALLGLGLAVAESRRQPAEAPQTGPLGPPRAALAFGALCLLLYANQVLLNAWALGPGQAPVAQLKAAFPGSFFHLAPEHAPVRWLAPRLAALPDLTSALPAELRPRGGLASLTLLRVQALLEAPWALMAWQLVARLLDPAAAARWARGPAGPLAALAHTLVLCIIEELLHNRYTDQDIALRLPGLLLAIALLRWSAGGPVPEHPPSAVHLALFSLGLAATSVLVLGGNLILLLYNLGWLAPLGPLLLAAALALVLALALSSLPAPASRSPLVLSLAEIGRAFLFTFGPGALAIRYGLSHPRALPLSAAAGAIAIFGALTLGLRASFARLPPEQRAAQALSLAAGLSCALPAALVDLAGPMGLPGASAPDVWLLFRAAQAFCALLFGYALATLFGGLWGPERAS